MWLHKTFLRSNYSTSRGIVSNQVVTSHYKVTSKYIKRSKIFKLQNQTKILLYKYF